MQQYFYKSDIKLSLALDDLAAQQLSPSALASLDFRGSISSGKYSPHPFRFSRTGSDFINCRIEDGKLVIIMDDHGLSPGELIAEIIFAVPDADFPDGFRDCGYKGSLGIELSSSGSAENVTAAASVTLAALYATAYDQAVAHGYDGSEDEWYAALSTMPSTVQRAEQVASTADRMDAAVDRLAAMTDVVADMHQGKSAVADMMRLKGIELPDSATYADIVDAIHDLRLATDDYLPDYDPDFDLYHCCSEHELVDYPGQAAICWDGYDGEEVALSDADAYLCSDGFFSTEGGTHAIEGDGTHWVIYYFLSPTYTFIPASAVIKRQLLTYKGDAVYMGTVTNFCGNAYLMHGGELRATASIFPQGSAQLIVGNITTLSGSTMHNASAELRAVKLPNLEQLLGGSLLTQNLCSPYYELPALRVAASTVASSNHYIRRLSLPNLAVAMTLIVDKSNSLVALSMPNLESYDGSWAGVVRGCSKLAALSLPSLRSIKGSNASFVSGCAALTSLSLLALETMDGVNTNIVGACSALKSLSLPALKSLSRSVIAAGCAALTSLFVPSLVSIGDNSMVQGVSQITIHFGRQVGAKSDLIYNLCNTPASVIGITNQEGFSCNININGYNNIPADDIKAFVANLGDNTGNPAKQITLGATLLAHLSPEEIALAQAKNYTLS